MADMNDRQVAEHCSRNMDARARQPIDDTASESHRARSEPLFVTHSVSRNARAKGRATG
jgi:hypothetical protein